MLKYVSMTKFIVVKRFNLGESLGLIGSFWSPINSYVATIFRGGRIQFFPVDVEPEVRTLSVQIIVC